MKRSRWTSRLLILIVSSGLMGCGQSLENALAPDPTIPIETGQSPQATPSTISTPKPGELDEEPIQATPQQFADIETAPDNLQTYIEDLARLEVLNPRGETAEGDPLFAPNQAIKRGTFVRWLVQTNNRLNRDRPTRQFRLASQDASDPIYTDVPRSHPDFSYIQGLAESGYLPSPLTGDDDKTFKPDVALDRETLLLWKVPIDRQKTLPTVTVAKVKETWGFKDADKISPKTASAIVADYDNEELSNIRRLVGATLLLQPQKSVTRAEAAAALWYFGVDGQGFSAKDIVRADVQSAASDPTEVSEGTQGESKAMPDGRPNNGPKDNSSPPAQSSPSPTN